jgi:hypothetical protein
VKKTLATVSLTTVALLSVPACSGYTDTTVGPAGIVADRSTEWSCSKRKATLNLGFAAAHKPMKSIGGGTGFGRGRESAAKPKVDHSPPGRGDGSPRGQKTPRVTPPSGTSKIKPHSDCRAEYELEIRLKSGDIVDHEVDSGTYDNCAVEEKYPSCADG